jgi:hypothetical protein
MVFVRIAVLAYLEKSVAVSTAMLAYFQGLEDGRWRALRERAW